MNYLFQGDWVKSRTSRKKKILFFKVSNKEALKLGVTKCLIRQLFCFLYRTDTLTTPVCCCNYFTVSCHSFFCIHCSAC